MEQQKSQWLAETAKRRDNIELHVGGQKWSEVFFWP